MPKRWKIVSGSGFGFELLDKHGTVIFRSPLDWDSEKKVDDELDDLQNGEIEFPDTSVKPPKHHRK